MSGTYRRQRLAAGLTMAIAALIGANLVQAEVVGVPKQGPDEQGHAIHEEPVALECWQKGRRIIQRDGLRGVAVKAVTQKGAVAFKQMEGDQADIFVLPFGDSLCLVGPED